jgi:hypothetical protein
MQYSSNRVKIGVHSMTFTTIQIQHPLFSQLSQSSLFAVNFLVLGFCFCVGRFVSFRLLQVNTKQ